MSLDPFFLFTFWIWCDLCKRWFHGKCVKITPEKAGVATRNHDLDSSFTHPTQIYLFPFAMQQIYLLLNIICALLLSYCPLWFYSYSVSFFIIIKRRKVLEQSTHFSIWWDDQVSSGIKLEFNNKHFVVGDKRTLWTPNNN